MKDIKKNEKRKVLVRSYQCLWEFAIVLIPIYLDTSINLTASMLPYLAPMHRVYHGRADRLSIADRLSTAVLYQGGTGEVVMHFRLKASS